mmetsp:Transcript_114663/g.202356  ORF Transcript_114663/g.202356 Transcript_114663/m.202356 type:complete len:295 (-) Transcript_114663:136-1020(-)
MLVTMLDKYDSVTHIHRSLGLVTLLAGVASTVCTCVAALRAALDHGDIPEWAVPIPMSFASSMGPSKTVYRLGFSVTAGLFLVGMPTFCRHYAQLYDGLENVPSILRRGLARATLVGLDYHHVLLACTASIGVSLALQGNITFSEAPASQLKLLNCSLAEASNDTMNVSQISLQDAVHGMSAGVFFNSCWLLYLLTTFTVFAKAPWHAALWKILPWIVGIIALFLASSDWNSGMKSSCGSLRRAGCLQWGVIASILVFVLTMGSTCSCCRHRTKRILATGLLVWRELDSSYTLV